MNREAKTIVGFLEGSNQSCSKARALTPATIHRETRDRLNTRLLDYQTDRYGYASIRTDLCLIIDASHGFIAQEYLANDDPAYIHQVGIFSTALRIIPLNKWLLTMVVKSPNWGPLICGL